jgi:squalene-associated FAD-dependent desaturase
MSVDVLILGGGAAGLSAAYRLNQAGKKVIVIEQKKHLGGRGCSYSLPEFSFPVDNCQHIITGACRNARNFFISLAGEDVFIKQKKFSVFKNSSVVPVSIRNYPPPLHLISLFVNLFGAGPRAWGAAVRILTLNRAPENKYPTAGSWLKLHQPAGFNRRFWYPMIKSALNEHPSRLALEGFKKWVYSGLLNNPEATELYIPRQPLGKVFQKIEDKLKIAGVEFKKGIMVSEIDPLNAAVICRGGEKFQADKLITALPPVVLHSLLPDSISGKKPFVNLNSWKYSPITSLHLLLADDFEISPVMFLGDSYFEWMFVPPHAAGNNYLQFIKSASYSANDNDRVLEEGQGLLEKISGNKTKIKKHRIITDRRATISHTPDFVRERFGPHTGCENFYVAGDWADNSYPATLEAAARSGIRAARAVCSDVQPPRSDLKPQGLMRLLV